jgi:Rrf2 family cysteine metabolism transcriptional repressor
MIRISRKCEYALRAVFELAVRNGERPVTMHRIASSQHIPRRFLEIILNDLRRAGLVQSRRGNMGGYILARPVATLTVREVVEHIQGAISVSPADGEKADGSKYSYGDDAFKELWGHVSKAVSGICEDTNFAELVANERRIKAGAVADYII